MPSVMTLTLDGTSVSCNLQSGTRFLAAIRAKPSDTDKKSLQAFLDSIMLMVVQRTKDYEASQQIQPMTWSDI